MTGDTRLMRWGERALRAMAGLNILFGVVFLLFVAASIVWQGALAAQLIRKYGGAPPVGLLIWQMRALGLLALCTIWPIDRCLRPLAEIVASVRAGAPFDPGNPHRVTTIGWALLAIQVIDVGAGLVIAAVERAGADTIGWQPSLAGWITVPVAFVLARVFAAGARMHADLEGVV